MEHTQDGTTVRVGTVAVDAGTQAHYHQTHTSTNLCLFPKESGRIYRCSVYI